MPDHFDVFLSHNSRDKPAVIKLAKRLKAHGLKVWLDVWELRPGQPWQEALEQIIETTKSAVVLVGADGFGPWQSREMRGCLSEFAENGKVVVPVLLPTCPSEVPKLPFFLKQLTWADLRDGKEESGFYHLIWGITGEKPKELEEDGFLIVPEQQGSKSKQNNRETSEIIIPHIHGWPAEKVQALQRETAQSLGLPISFRDKLTSGGEGPLMAVIPSGSFLMGSPDDEPERDKKKEGPQHQVSFARPFAIGVYAVTFDDYDLYCQVTGRKLVEDSGWGRKRRPVTNVSWRDAVDYCAWLSGQTGQHYRLPTEAEWEYACRAGTVTPFHFGDNINPKQVNYNGNEPYCDGAKGEYRNKTVPVDEFQSNAFGLYQMHGNVLEWCADTTLGTIPKPRRWTRWVLLARAVCGEAGIVTVPRVTAVPRTVASTIPTS